MNERERRIRKRLRDDFEHYAAKNLKIRTKSGALAPLILNRAQRYVHEIAERQRRELGYVRIILLKARQQGLSTYIEGRFYWRVTHAKGLRAFILTHEDEATKNLFEMAERFHAHCNPLVKPSTGAANARELHFDKLDSGYKVATAGTKAVGRSGTNQLLHASEAAFWPHAETHKAGVIQTVPREVGTEVWKESTGNGVGGVFYEDWQDAKAGKTDDIAVFIPWYWDPGYRLAVPADFAATKDERDLAKLYGLDAEQLAWRRAKIAEIGPELFCQEYPATDDEAFIYSGRPVFQRTHIHAAMLECFSPAYSADVSLESGALTKRDDGRLRVWDDPEPGAHYVIGADVAEGLEQGDFSCADVLKLPDGEQVAQWHGHIDPDRFGEVLYRLGRHYNRGLIGVERNNHGLTTLTTLKHKGYPFVYAQEDIERRSDGYQTKKAGWLTTRKSKVKIIDQLAAELRDGDHGIVCTDTIHEMGTYVINDDGSTSALPGRVDDRVMARAIAGEMLLSAPRSRRRKPQSEAA